MATLTKSLTRNIKTVEGNPLALFIDDVDGIIKLKDVKGDVAPLSDYVNGGGSTSLIVDTTTIQNGGGTRLLFQNQNDTLGEDTLLVWDALSGLGVGIAQPLGRLHINADGANNVDAILQGLESADKNFRFMVGDAENPSDRWNVSVSGAELGANEGSDLYMWGYNDAGAQFNSPWFFIKRSTGYVGLNTLIPQYRLHIQADVSDPTLDVALDADGTLTKSYLWLTDGDTRWASSSSGQELGANSGSDWYLNGYSDAGGLLGNWMYVQRSSGFVGINTTSPAGKLHIYDDSAVRLILDADTNQARIFSFRSAGLQRWAFRVDDTESGANAGSNMHVRRYNDAGTYVDDVITLVRDSGDTYLHKNTGIGYSYPSTLNGRLSVRGSSDTTGSAFYVQSLSNEAFRVYNNRQIVSGGGSSATTTDFTFNAFTSGADIDSRRTATYNDSSTTDNIFRIMNSPGWTRGGIEIQRSITSAARNAIRIFGSTTANLTITSNGTITFDTANAYQDTALSFIQRSSTTYAGMLFNLDNTEAANFTFHKGRGTTGATQGNNLPFVDLNNVFIDAGQTFNGTVINLGIRPTYNYTGAGTVNAVGIDYNPTVTSLNGLHVGAKIRVGYSAFGLGSTDPTAFIDVAAATSAAASLRIRSSAGTNPSSPNSGDLWWNATNLNFRAGSTTRSIAFNPEAQTVNATGATVTVDLSLGSVVTLNLQSNTSLTLTNPTVGTFIIIAKQDGTGGRTLAYTTTIYWPGGVAPTITTTANYSDIITLVYNGSIYRGNYAQNYST